ncbi:cobalamin B12-binding domain protein [Desulfatibacillum aliphaticivorans]|uniref:Cobalamin B12-binding domain protein n=1 Tax=Desulfatibacillum aliphaticivorans TaxID=218208 RepID=B8FF36_DESAL|nr:B12-binding domain-containing radical SAM protein [Desulfatibacillum aliphaticivorans]ACL03853.1 cobalamin B12-binding domain protein [Desulfatibacillum aliphaticivorans]
MNIVLVYKGRYVIRQALDLETLAAVLKAGGRRVSLVHDPDPFGVTDNVFQIPALAKRFSSPEKIAKKILEFRPDAIVFSALPNTLDFCLKTAGLVKQRSTAPVIFLGLHPTLSPEYVIGRDGVDYVIEGEAEESLPALLDALEKGESPENIAGLWRKDGGAIINSPPGPPVDLDALPLPDKDLFAPRERHDYSYAAMVSRGCPFSCTYCEETCIKQKCGPKYFRRKSVKSVMAELTAARAKYGFREVIFKDSYLSGDEDWLARLMAEYKSRIRLPFKCFCTISGFTENTAMLLKQGGCYGIEFGLQTWNEAIRRDVLNRKETNAQAREVFGLCDAWRLRYDVDHMFNLPGESANDHVLGAREYKKLKYLNRIKVHYLVYLPGAPIVDAGVQAGLLTQKDASALHRGVGSDFYDQQFGDPGNKELAAGFGALYKMLPFIPAPMLERVLEGNKIPLLGKIPAPVMAGVQAARALQTRDLRFALYLRKYPAQLFGEAMKRMGES